MPPYHVLVADDDDAIRSLIARVLVHTYPAVTIWAVKDGKEALDIYDQQQLDLVISNYHMPRLDGFALLAILRRSRQATLPILMISASISIQPQARALVLRKRSYLVFHCHVERSSTPSTEIAANRVEMLHFVQHDMVFV